MMPYLRVLVVAYLSCSIVVFSVRNSADEAKVGEKHLIKKHESEIQEELAAAQARIKELEAENAALTSWNQALTKESCTPGWYTPAMKKTDFCVASHKADDQCSKSWIGCKESGGFALNPLSDCSFASDLDDNDVIYVKSSCVWYKTKTRTNTWKTLLANNNIMCPDVDEDYCQKRHDCNKNYVPPSALKASKADVDVSNIKWDKLTTCTQHWDHLVTEPVKN